MNQANPKAIKGTTLLQQTIEAFDPGAFSGIVHEGGSRSSKTYSIIQFCLWYAQRNAGKGKVITIARKRLTWLKATLYLDFMNILREYGFYLVDNHNKSERFYYHFDTMIRFIGLDEVQKLHGLSQDVFVLNEADESTVDDFDQLEQRTRDFWLMDFNPKYTEHYIFDKVIPRPDVKHVLSTVFDNPFVSPKEKKKILSYRPTTENIANGTADLTKWKVYGLGQRAKLEGLIFPDVEYLARDQFPEPEACDFVAYGLDFGFSDDPTALILCMKRKNNLFVHEAIFSSGLTNPDIAATMKDEGVDPSDEVIADSAEPKSIQEIVEHDFFVVPAEKGPDSIRYGINTLRSLKIICSEESINLKKEFENYKFKKDEQRNRFLPKPIDDFNHGIDAIRYVALNKIGRDDFFVL